MKILGVIPARSGSKGVKNKNIRLLSGKPLIAYTIESGLKSKMITDLVVTTDSEEIRRIAMIYGAQCPFLRPMELSHDSALAVPTIQHAVKEMEEIKKTEYDYVVMLQPTSPLKLAEDIDDAIKMLIINNADGIISVVDVGNNHPMKMKKYLSNDGISGELVDYEAPPKENCPRQELPPVFIVNGAIYATKRNVLMKYNSFKGKYCIGFTMPPEKSVNIDNEFDFYLAEYLINKK